MLNFSKAKRRPGRVSRPNKEKAAKAALVFEDRNVPHPHTGPFQRRTQQISLRGGCDLHHKSNHELMPIPSKIRKIIYGMWAARHGPARNHACLCCASHSAASNSGAVIKHLTQSAMASPIAGRKLDAPRNACPKPASYGEKAKPLAATPAVLLYVAAKKPS